MLDIFAKLTLRLVDSAEHASWATALVLVALMSLSVTALSLWTLTAVVRL